VPGGAFPGFSARWWVTNSLGTGGSTAYFLVT
jgi:hypothetical protein